MIESDAMPVPSPRPRFLLCALLLAAPAWAQAPLVPAHAIVGEWRGTSLCTDRKLAPACKDEEVRYVFTALAKTGEGVHLAAEKMVAGSYQPMYEIDMLFNAAAHEWRHEFDAPGFRGRWFYSVDGAALTGGVLAVETKAMVRKVSARRQ
jgi:hypothetical protein